MTSQPASDLAAGTTQLDAAAPPFAEGPFSRPICALGLAIEGTPLESVIQQFEEEVRQCGITRVKPHCYLSTEWGVPFGTVAIGIPFYLATPELVQLHGARVGHIEGAHRADILRYLRHEMGHVVNYAYRLYDREDWVRQFGSMTQPYEEDYRPEPFSRSFVRHLPGWYAQKHPDEDWSETFAVWMTPGSDWRSDYADWPHALAKLEYCDRLMRELADQDPPVSLAELDEHVNDLSYSVDEYYRRMEIGPEDSLPPGLDGSLRAIFDDLAEAQERDEAHESLPASKLIHQLRPRLMAEVYRWTGHFPERTRRLLEHMATRADELKQVYHPRFEREASLSLTVLVASLAMNFVLAGGYYPEPRQSPRG